MALPSFKKVLSDNDIVQQALKGGPIDSELYKWLGADVLKLSYIKNDLEQGRSAEEVSRYYNVTIEGVYKFLFTSGDKKLCHICGKLVDVNKTKGEGHCFEDTCSVKKII